MFSLNINIYIQKSELAFWDKYLINFFLANISSTYKGIIDNLNIYDILILEKMVYILHIKKTKFINLRIIKEEKVHFTSQKKFCDRQKY